MHLCKQAKAAHMGRQPEMLGVMKSYMQAAIVVTISLSLVVTVGQSRGPESASEWPVGAWVVELLPTAEPVENLSSRKQKQTLNMESQHGLRKGQYSSTPPTDTPSLSLSHFSFSFSLTYRSFKPFAREQRECIFFVKKCHGQSSFHSLLVQK